MHKGMNKEKRIMMLVVGVLWTLKSVNEHKYCELTVLSFIFFTM